MIHGFDNVRRRVSAAFGVLLVALWILAPLSHEAFGHDACRDAGHDDSPCAMCFCAVHGQLVLAQQTQFIVVRSSLSVEPALHVSFAFAQRPDVRVHGSQGPPAA